MRILLLTAIIIFASSASAGLYKWVDNEGNIHYSQKRPIGTQFKKLKAPAPVPENTKPLYQPEKPISSAEKTLATEKIKIEKAKAAKCEEAKKNLNTYTVYRRLLDKNGELQYIDDKVRDQQIKAAKTAIKDYC